VGIVPHKKESNKMKVQKLEVGNWKSKFEKFARKQMPPGAGIRKEKLKRPLPKGRSSRTVKYDGLYLVQKLIAMGEAREAVALYNKIKKGE